MAKKRKSILHQDIDMKVFVIIILAIALCIVLWGLVNQRNLANLSQAANPTGCNQCNPIELEKEKVRCYNECKDTYCVYEDGKYSNCNTSKITSCRTNCLNVRTAEAKRCEAIGC